MAETPGKQQEVAGATVVVEDSATSALPFYSFEVWKTDTQEAKASDLGGVSPKVLLRIPPSNLRITTSIRSDVSIDLMGDLTVANGGLGLRRWTISGTHGVGANTQMIGMAANGQIVVSEGYAVRLALANLFEAWALKNEELRKAQQPQMRMMFAVRNGSLSEFQNEEWWIQPDSLPEESRSAARPHSWEWSLSFIALKRRNNELQKSDWKNVPLMPLTAQGVQDKVDSATAQIDKAAASAQVANKTSLLAKITSIKADLESIKTKVSSAVSTYRRTVSDVSGYIRSCASTVHETLLMLDRSNLFDQPARDLYLALRECQTALGAAKMLYDGYLNQYDASPVVPVSTTIQPGDTLQSIAQRVYGDATRWKELADLNGLSYPYLDFSGSNGAPASQFLSTGKKVLGASDTLKLPNSSDAVAPVDPVGTDMGDGGTVKILVAGVDNLRAALLRRLRTPKGWLPHHPEYGSALYSYIGEPLTPALVLSIRAEVDRVLREDPRIISVQMVGVSVDTDAIKIEATATSALGPVSLSGTVGGLLNT